MPNSLPFIQIQNPPIKLLIDTGCHPSILRPYIAEKYYPKSIFKSETPIVTCAGTSKAIHKAHIPVFDELKPLTGDLEFVLFNFHEYFDGIIGTRDLRELGLNINFENKTLYNDFVQIPLHYRTEFNLQKIEVPPCSSILKRIRTNLPNSEFLIPSLKLDKIIIPESLIEIKDGTVVLEFINSTNQTEIATLSENFLESFANKFDSQSYECFNIEQITSHQPTENSDFDFSLIRSNHLNSEEKNALKQLLKKHKNILHRPDDKLTFTNRVKHQIKTTDEVPVHTKSYRYPYVHKQEVQKQIQKMLDDGIITPSQSPWSSPIWIVPKKLDASGKQKWRIVVDYRKVNEKTIDDRYPLPNISDILDKLGRCQYFTTLDLASGFHQIEMHPDSIPKTAFSVEHGHYEFVRMPFGLKNAPATFQRVMDDVLKGLQNKICLVYMDDIIIFSTSLQEHINNLKLVFERLSQAGLKIQLDKSEFLCKSVEFLGHVITPEGIRPNPKKIEAIRKFPIPKTAKEIKSFLGLIGYYRKFIKNFAQLTKPMTRCLKKDSKIEHTPEFVNCFETCKTILMNDPILQYPDFSKPFVLTTDASKFAIGAVLSQGPIGKDLPIAYASRTLNPAEINYSTIEKELLAIVWAVKYFRPYLFGVRFKVVTDHKPLRWLFSLKEPNSKLVRWRLKLAEYDYEIIHKKGKLNTNADALSRVEIHPIDTQPDIDNVSVIVNPDQTPYMTYDITQSDIEDFLEKEFPSNPIPSNEKIIIHENKLLTPQISNTSNKMTPENILFEPETTDSQTIHTEHENPILDIPYTERPINTYKNQIIFSTSERNKNTSIFRKKIFDKTRLEVSMPKQINDTHFITFTKENMRPGQTYCIYFKNKNLEPVFIRTLQEYFKNNAFNIHITNTLLTDVIDEDEQKLKLKYYHETKTSHRGIQENLQAIKKSFYWPKIDQDVRDYVNSCDICQQTKYERHPTKLVYKPTPVGHEPFDHLYIDTYKTHGQYFITIIDSFSKFGQAYPIKALTAVEIANKLIQYFNHFGIPRKMTVDNGHEFKNELIQGLSETHKIEIHYTTLYNPNSNSPVERFHSTLAETILTLKMEKPNEPIEMLMNYALLSYNNSVHSSTNYTPFAITRGKLNYRNPFEIDEPTRVSQYLQDHIENIKELNQLVLQKVTDRQLNKLENINKNRQASVQIDPSKPLYKSKKCNASKKKATNPYELVENPTLIGDNKIETKNKIYHQNLLKPQRFVSGGNNAPSYIDPPPIPGPSL